MPPTIVLASSSIYRRQLLGKLLENFEAGNPAIDETPYPEESPADLVQRLSLAKAQKLAREYANALIIGSDQVASLHGAVLTKPGGFNQAQNQLRRCSGQRVEFFTGLCLLDSESGEYDLVCETFAVQFRELSQNEIDAYLHREQPYDCAGSFKVEGLGICLFEALQGKDPNTLVGLPLITLADLLRRRGVNPLLVTQVSAIHRPVD
jgi:MAF protein